MKYAVGVLNIKPIEFWELTLAEFNIMMEAHNWRQEQELWKMAQLASWVTMPHLKHPLTAHDFMGEDDEPEDKPVTTKEDIEEMKKRMGL